MANPLCHFEFMVSDVEKAKTFYSRVFDWKFGDMSLPGTQYLSIDTGTPPGGGMMKKPDTAPMFGLSSYFFVDNIDETLKKVTAAGGRVQMPKMEIPTIGWWALFMDPDGIPVVIFEALAK
jgi:predicted enzyme related to lactoylglutathione lyase